MDPLPASLESAIRTRLRERRAYGLAVCGFAADGIRFAGGVGYADLRRAEFVTPETVFRVASISKLFTSALVLRLVESGLLDLDEPANSYLPRALRISDGSGEPADFSLRSLLSHSSGLPPGVRGIDAGHRALSLLANGGRVRNLAEAISGLQVVRPAGERLVYSNPGFNVAGYVAARALGTGFEEAARREVLGPLGMAASEFTPQRRGPGVATPYGSILPPGPGGEPLDGLRLVATPMGGLTTTVDDLARFGRMVLNRGRAESGRFLSRQMLDAATSREAANHPDLEQGYGLGFRVRTWCGRTLIGHDGNMPGVATQLVLSPADGVGVAVLTNGSSLAVPHEIAALGLRHLLGWSPGSGPAAGAGAGPAAGAAPAAGAVLGDETGTGAGEAAEREELAGRLEGPLRLLDSSPPGPVGRITDLTLRIRAAHEVGGRLRVDGYPGADGPMWLEPAGPVGRYRVAAAVDDATNAVADERPDGLHLWLGYTAHLRVGRGRRPLAAPTRATSARRAR